MTIVLVFPDIYPYILMAITANFVLCNISGILTVPTKLRIMKREFGSFREKLSDEHKKYFGAETEVDQAGLPDQGEGWYVQKLPYKD